MHREMVGLVYDKSNISAINPCSLQKQLQIMIRTKFYNPSHKLLYPTDYNEIERKKIPWYHTTLDLTLENQFSFSQLSPQSWGQTNVAYM